MRYYKEIILFEAIIFICLWLWDEYVATLVTFIAVPIFFAILSISFLAEKIERSRISKSYFLLMLGLAVIPIFIFIAVYISNGGSSLDWTKE